MAEATTIADASLKLHENCLVDFVQFTVNSLKCFPSGSAGNECTLYRDYIGYSIEIFIDKLNKSYEYFEIYN